MPETGVNSTFKKIVYESSEMVFLADDTYPFAIFYGNELFEKEIGDKLDQRNLVGLGMDVNSYIFKEELVLATKENEYSFSLELPHENESNYYLFYHGTTLAIQEVPSKSEAMDYIKSNKQCIAIGECDLLTFLNAAALAKLGYQAEDLINTSLKKFIYKEDLKKFSKAWGRAKKQGSSEDVSFRFQKNDLSYIRLDVQISFSGERFFISSTSKKVEQQERLSNIIQKQLIIESENLTEVGCWTFDSSNDCFKFDTVAQKLLDIPKVVELNKKQIKKSIRVVFKDLAKGFESNSKGEASLIMDQKESLRVSWEVSAAKGQIAGILWSDSRIQGIQDELNFFQTLFIDSPEAMVLVRESGSILLVNTEARKLFDFTDSDTPIHLNDFANLVLEGEQASAWVLSEPGNAKERLTSIKNNLGQTLTLEIKSKSITAEKQNCIAISFRNVTDKVILEQSLEDSTEFLMNLTDQVPGGLYQMVLSSEGEIRFAFLSKGIRAVLGITSEEAENLRDIRMALENVHPADLPNVVMTSIASAKKLEPWICQFRVRISQEGDEYRWVMGGARPQVLANSDMVWYGYLTDISQQKEFEERLDEAKIAAEKANQIKSDFLSMISHELRTPLNAISGSVYSLLQESPSDYQKSALNTINFAVDNLIIMINDLLDFQKIEAGKLHIENASFNLSDLLNQIVKGLIFHARDSKNRLHLDLEPSLDLLVRGDKTRISQVLNNLITNALKFTNQGVVSVKVTLKEKFDQKVRVYFEVVDNGIGIAPEHQSKIFDDFDQVRPTFNKKYGGTGLGLSITRKLLKIMGSDIALKSAVGEGSKFYFEIDFDLNQEELSANSIIPLKPSLPGKLHLLMAEDNEVNALVLGKIISKWGYTFDRVVNGLEAVKAMQESDKYNCVLMDIQMPEMNGFDATKAIKSQHEIPVIALTAAAKLEIMEQIKDCGFDGFVAKPIDAAELHDVIREVVEKYHSRA